MASHNELGKKGEQIAQNYLQQQQYTVLHINWKWGRKEIDVIALKDGHLVFVEVKTRINSVFGWPEEKVLAYLQAESGRHFDPAVVEAFMQMDFSAGTGAL